MKEGANDSGKIWRTYKDIEEEHDQVDYEDPEIESAAVDDLTKILSILEDFDEEAEQKEKITQEKGNKSNRLSLIIKTFTNIGEILYFEKSQVVVTDPRRFTEKIVREIVDHNIIERDSSQTKTPQEIHDALHRGLFLPKSDHDDEDLVEGAIQNLEEENVVSQKQEVMTLVVMFSVLCPKWLHRPFTF